MLEPARGGGGISEAALVPVGTGTAPTAVWSEGSEGQGDKKHREVKEAVSQGGGRRQPLSRFIYCAAWPLCNFLGS